jgi:hypothetical protein
MDISELSLQDLKTFCRVDDITTADMIINADRMITLRVKIPATVTLTRKQRDTPRVWRSADRAIDFISKHFQNVVHINIMFARS